MDVISNIVANRESERYLGGIELQDIGMVDNLFICICSLSISVFSLFVYEFILPIKKSILFTYLLTIYLFIHAMISHFFLCV